MKNQKLKLVFYNSDKELTIENIWVKKEGKNFRVKSVPFYAPNIAFNDLIKAEKDENELYFDELIASAGHSTVQIIVLNEAFKEKIITELENLNCSWEGMHNQLLLAVDISPKIDYLIIKKCLENYKNKMILDYKESCLVH